ncbi:SRPBCC family protein [Paludisphaera rhizosphaerae]|uniref:SRPBCC family protein n=1 Tax=Paludisphaera rhizosphaerae TaxID=2711216 RepID=UPI0013ECF293|nr:SRPBCC domain-containing protein [Paludisphaera rhizosphaerae]
MPEAASRSIVVERVMSHPPEKVWRALTEGPLIERWLMANDFQPVPGHRFNFRAEPRPQWNGVTDCEVLTVEPLKKLSYRWRSSGEEAADGLDTVVTWTLEPAVGGTLVRMEHAGFRAEDDGFYKGAGYGWPKFVDGLERVAAELG